ncbi:ATP synthase subunit I [Paenibacillus sp.]|uniref:ATP synthase subunit I n=1 Tax=Paenibacillus sp. TaxID=58172 RepID=UPI002D56BE20|nr:ATP synthase subunit I [Paenibacillus sp.]HZG87333.1 ATP synthase subunit I [Paenibacillus sp.]
MAELLTRAVRTALFFMSALLAAWALVPEGKTIAAGLMLGTAASVVNALLLRRRVEAAGKLAAEGGARKVGLGMGARMATVLLAAMIAYRYPEQFSVPAALASCFFVQFVVFFTAVVQNKHRSDGKG